MSSKLDHYKIDPIVQTMNNALERVLLRIVRGDQDGARALLKAK